MSSDLERAVVDLLEGMDLVSVSIDWETQPVPPEEAVQQSWVEHRRTGAVTVTVRGRLA